ncbi:MAG: hypothetical protein IJ622_03575 [Bacteroidales bacterium]|nr:hypothetical protein [Bacteroidales bacterium]
MKKHLILFAAFALMFLTSFGSQTEKPYLLKVKMKETDCFRCVQGQITMRDLAAVADVEIVFNGLNDRTIEQFLKTNALEYVKGNEDFKIVSDKEEYAHLNTIPSVSEGHLFNKNGNEILVFQFRLDNATQNRLSAIKRKGKALMQKEPITLQTDYNNDGIDFSVQGKHFVLCNRPMNLCQIFNSNGKLVREIDGNSVDPSDVFPELKEMDSTILKSIKGYGYYRSSIEDVFINGNEIWANFTVSYPTYEDEKVSLCSPFQVLSYSLNDSTQHFKVLFDSRQNQITTMVFNYINYGNVLPFLHDVLQKYNQEGQSIYNQAICEVRNDSLILKDERPVSYPKFEQQQLLWYKPKLKDGLLNLLFTEYLVDIQTDTAINLPFRYNTKVVDNGGFDIKSTFDALLVDWAFDGETLGVIYNDFVDGQRSKSHYLVWQKVQKGFTEKEFSLPDAELVALQLVLPDVINYLTTDNKVGTMVLE